MRSRKPALKSTGAEIRKTRGAKAAALPAYLLGVEGLLPSYAGVIAVNQSDGGHAGLNAMPALKALCKPLQIPITVNPTIGIMGVKYVGLINGLTINKVSLAAGKVEPLTSLRRVDAGKLAAAWTHRTAPVFNICATGATKPPKPTIRRDAMTIFGMSGSVFLWTWYATIAAIALRPEVRARRLASGELCWTILDLLTHAVATHDADGYFPDIAAWSTAETMETAEVVAKFANSVK